MTTARICPKGSSRAPLFGASAIIIGILLLLASPLLCDSNTSQSFLVIRYAESRTEWTYTPEYVDSVAAFLQSPGEWLAIIYEHNLAVASNEEVLTRTFAVIDGCAVAFLDENSQLRIKGLDPETTCEVQRDGGGFESAEEALFQHAKWLVYSAMGERRLSVAFLETGSSAKSERSSPASSPSTSVSAPLLMNGASACHKFYQLRKTVDAVRSSSATTTQNEGGDSRVDRS